MDIGLLQRPRTKLLVFGMRLKATEKDTFLVASMMYRIHTLLCQLDLGELDQGKDSNMLTNNIIAIDLAKNVRQACHISVHGELLSDKPLSRRK
ncbi:hypothetical protein ACS88_05490 [Vibrio parahaemolyticus]|nr:hypothetical protein ACS88_05490 [Vibrio parahaemolyticus]